MWGFGGRYYWGARERKTEGIIVVFAWMSSQERHVRSYVELYSSLGWNSLVCHSQFLNMFFPEKAETLAFDVLKELLQVLQIIEAMCGTQLSPDDCRLVRGCISGHIFDSSPVDFTSDLGKRFVVHPTVVGLFNPPRILSWMANGISNGLDALFLNRFESHRAQYWQTPYSSISMGAPYLILCSETDDLAPYQVICNFSQRLSELGADVKLVTMKVSSHVGHYRLYPIDYKAAVTEHLGKAAALYSHRTQRLEGERMGIEGAHDEISELISNLRKSAACMNQSFFRAPIALTDHCFMPSSVGYCEGRDVGSLQEHEEGLVHLPSPPRINAHGVLGEILFDVCVPRNVEDWDVKTAPSSMNGRSFTSTRRHAPFPIKCIRRSRL